MWSEAILKTVIDLVVAMVLALIYCKLVGEPDVVAPIAGFFIGNSLGLHRELLVLKNKLSGKEEKNEH